MASSHGVQALSKLPNWPTPETHDLWLEFVNEFRYQKDRSWQNSRTMVRMRWYDEGAKRGEFAVRLRDRGGYSEVLSGDYEPLGRSTTVVSGSLIGLMKATVTADPETIELDYLGPERPFADLM